MTFHFCVPPSLKQSYTGTGILNPFSIAYAFRPRLRVRLTLSRVTLLRKPWAFGEPEFHGLYRYSCQHTHFHLLQLPSRVNLHRLMERSPTTPTNVEVQSFGIMLSPGYYRRKTPRLVSCYAFFKGWLLLSQPPSCLGDFTSFIT